MMQKTLSLRLQDVPGREAICPGDGAFTADNGIASLLVRLSESEASSELEVTPTRVVYRSLLASALSADLIRPLSGDSTRIFWQDEWLSVNDLFIHMTELGVEVFQKVLEVNPAAEQMSQVGRPKIQVRAPGEFQEIVEGQSRENNWTALAGEGKGFEYLLPLGGNKVVRSCVASSLVLLGVWDIRANAYVGSLLSHEFQVPINLNRARVEWVLASPLVAGKILFVHNAQGSVAVYERLAYFF